MGGWLPRRPVRQHKSTEQAVCRPGFYVLFHFFPLCTFNRFFALTRRIDWLAMSDTESEGSKGEGNTLGVRHDINKQFVTLTYMADSYGCLYAEEELTCYLNVKNVLLKSLHPSCCVLTAAGVRGGQK